MSFNQQLVEDQLRSCLQTGSLERHTGATHAEVFILHDVFKVGAPTYIDLELGIYRDLQIRLGDLYTEIFPQVTLRQRDSERAMLEMTWLGRFSAEDILASLSQGEWTPILARWPDAQPIRDKLALIGIAIERTLACLDAMFATSCAENPTAAGAFVDETLAALRVNLDQAGLLPELISALGRIESARNHWRQGLAISACHRDLMMGHIYIQKNGDELTIRLADPKSAVPRLDETPEGLGRVPSSLGCPAVDLAHLEISLYRRQLELQRVNPAVNLPSLAQVRANVVHWIAQERFTRPFYELCLAAYFSAYAGCRCDYCLSPERRWLYDQMTADCRTAIARCSTMV